MSLWRFAPVLLVVACSEPPRGGAPTASATVSAAPTASAKEAKPAIPPSWMTLESPAFKANEPIPAKYTCQGANVSPALKWTQIPGGTKSLAIIVEDPDAPDPKEPKMVWGHWVLYNISPEITEVPEGVKNLKGAREGYNDFRRARYEGPCPARGRHRYFYKLYALDFLPGYLELPSREDLLRRIDGHILGVAELMGTYEKTAR
jgi:Raf kinase inhibitor-like YbhB/YbcL family protein